MEFDLKIYGIVTIAYYGQVCDYDGTSNVCGCWVDPLVEEYVKATAHCLDQQMRFQHV